MSPKEQEIFDIITKGSFKGVTSYLVPIDTPKGRRNVEIKASEVLDLVRRKMIEARNI